MSRLILQALAWCPFQSNLLASGGGTADRCIKTWNTHTGALLNSVDTKSQVRHSSPQYRFSHVGTLPNYYWRIAGCRWRHMLLRLGKDRLAACACTRRSLSRPYGVIH